MNHPDHESKRDIAASHPDHKTTEVLVVVAFPELQTSTSEEAWEQDIRNAVSAAVYADKTLDTLAVRLLEDADCQGGCEAGMPMPDYDLTVFQDGSWQVGEAFPGEELEVAGEDLQSLFDYLVKKGLVKK